jgi:adenosylcobinamide kinase/adenosylcobinamide-phosphate guanylyltransferase
MEVYFGGAFQGKLEYVLEKKGCLKVADGAGCSLKDIKEAQVLNHLHLYIKRLTYKEGAAYNTTVDDTITADDTITVDTTADDTITADTTAKTMSAAEIINDIYEANPDIILICDEVGGGIVPLKKEDRIYRETVGRALCCAVKKSDRVERVMCGIGQCLKCDGSNK